VYRAGGSHPGDAPAGRVVYNRICAQCHTLFGEGGKIGPDLTGSNRANLDYILENIVTPNAVIPNEYRVAMVEMKDGRVLSGTIKQQDEKSITLATLTEQTALARADVKSLEMADVSMMPEGLMGVLSEKEVRDLIYYLAAPAQVPLPVTAAQ
jgi:putative heme-binding domain-containing protein